MFSKSFVLKKVHGWNQRTNDILIKLATPIANEVTVFFGGDIQDLESRMATVNMYKGVWSLEKTVDTFSNYYPKSHIIAVCPSRKSNIFVNYFDNFVQMENTNPRFDDFWGATTHLHRLLKNSGLEINKLMSEETTKNYTDISSLPLRIIAFSKGSTALNQILHEIYFLHRKSENEATELLEEEAEGLGLIYNIKEVIYLDPGHSGRKEIFVTSPLILKTLVDLKVEIEVHVTPYQIEYEARPWVNEEYLTFAWTLGHLDAKLNANEIHFGDEIGTLERHFDVLGFKS